MTDKQKPENTGRQAGTGNASNPSPNLGARDGADNNQLLDQQAEKYIRESGNIEDYPDAADMQKAEERMNKLNEES